MTSGKRLTEQERDAILRLASYRAQDGGWLMSCEQIGHQLDWDGRTVQEVIRRAAAAWWLEHRWHAPAAGDEPDRA